MRLSLLQPEIHRGDIDYNTMAIQRLIDASEGDLLVLPEFALTGSLVLDPQADVAAWAERSAQAVAGLHLPPGKRLMINRLLHEDDALYNCCELLPSGQRQIKLHPDDLELEAGIRPGTDQTLFDLDGKRFKVIICTDLRHMDSVPSDSLDFALWIFHFTDHNMPRAMDDVRRVSRERGLSFFVSSLVSDQNVGRSAYINGDLVVALPEQEGILEVTLL